ncbi:methionine--tRNA ligase [Ruminococcus champanellensis]|uniref:Methionine--tRNA ligase n=1 Tax=Ruminococcus champanellensis (strain DSM 18848 / JCM 17042 / KCTC 15320 / 18P13) TaxID=213810 RepID=D4LFB2_RUMC1|nr:methionine--tRNA ligase [Ruminococcus champanellensis]CBL18307.1 methionyl-tRNA synthetase [Ruminococcus champanellensis 18P13 = JCM 17042]
MSKKPYYITTAIAYASRKPHIGNTYEVVFTDAVARYKRMQGYDVFFLTGTDEHGVKIEELAKSEGITPKEHVDKVVGEIQDICKLMHISYDGFIRTTDPRHEEVVQKIFKKLYDQGDIYKSEYEGMYCTPCESFWTPSQLVDGKCPDCGREVQPAKEEAYFLRLSKYQQWLEEYIETHPDFIVPEGKKKEMMNNFIKPGLQDLCVSRTTFQWGIPVTFDPKHVIYVWVDALSNYITAMGYDPDGSSDQFKKYWPCDCHVIGKDIMRFHSIYWPVMLHALGLELPRQLFGHNWILFGEDKMSKSRGNVIYASDVVDAFGVDAARYYLLSEMPYGSDGSITYESLIERFNTDLANTLGNLVNRTIAMAQKYFGGVIQPADAAEPVDADLRATALKTVEEVDRLMNQYRMADTLDAVISLARRSNKYIDETMPWVLAKDEAQKPRLGAVLYNLLESIRFLAVLLQPFMPETAEKIFAQLNTDCKDYASLSAFGGLHAGDKVGEPVPLFGRIDAEQMIQQLKAKQEAAAAPAQEPAQEAIQLAPEISIEDFAKVELRVAKVLSAEKVKKSSKLLCIQLDDGMGGRQVVSGIAKWYKPEELVGKKVIVVANLKPVKLCGVESNGMICAADLPDGSVRVLFADDSMACGAKIR